MAITLYRNDKVMLDFRMSKFLRNLIEEADELYEKDDWFWYDMKRSEIEAPSKQEVLSGIITDEQRENIWERYNGSVVKTKI